MDSLQDKIHKVEMKLEESSGDREVFLMLMGKEKQLREEKKQLREEKKQLRDMMILRMKEKKPPPTGTYLYNNYHI